MRNPNGFGSVYKLTGKRRKPFIARKTIGWDEKGKQLYQTIGYYEKRELALKALIEYNANPYSIEVSTITFKEVFEKWSEQKFKEVSNSSINAYKASFAFCEDLYDIKFVDLRSDHMKEIINECEKGHATKRKIKVLFNQLYAYAMEHDIVTKDYSEYVKVGANEEESDRKPFTQDEIELLWDNVYRMDFIDTILIMIYTGIRIGELLIIENENIDIDQRTMKGGIKTEAGKNRIIPINYKILDFVKKRKSQGGKYLIKNHEGNEMRYWNYYEEKWKKIMEQLEMDHKPHDCRHTFATLMDNAGANKVSIKRIMGHSSTDITDKVYTHKDIEELKKAIDLI